MSTNLSPCRSSRNSEVNNHRQEYKYFRVNDSDDMEFNDGDRGLLLDSFATVPSHRYFHNLKKKQVILGITVMVCVIVGAIIAFLLLRKNDANNENSDTNGIFSSGAISIDGKVCAKIGYDVIRRNGTAADAAIAALFCNGAFCPQSMGIGGGFGMIYYRKSDKKMFTLDAREWAPKWSNSTMFNGDQESSTTGPLSIAVPGEIKGYWEMKKKLGNDDITWESLIRPTIEMARNGIHVSKHSAKSLAQKRKYIFMNEGMKETFVNPATNDVYKEGDVYKREKLARTLEKIAQDPLSFYEGEMAKKISREIKMDGGIITEDDLRSYKVEWKEPVSFDLSEGIKVSSIAPPFSGANLIFIFNILSHYLPPEFRSSYNSSDPSLMYHRITEAFKWAYGMRSQLGDPNDKQIAQLVNELVGNMSSKEYGKKIFKKIDDEKTVSDPVFYGGDFEFPEDKGTSQLSMIAPNGDAISITSTVNTYFGSKFMGPDTGIIYNDEMDDFSSPNITNIFGLKPSPHNFIKPQKRPMSSMSPAIFVNADGDVVLSIGAAGGTRITSSTAFVSIFNLWLGESLDYSVDQRRIHHQLIPMKLFFETGCDKNILSGLKSRGHILEEIDLDLSIVNAVSRNLDLAYHAYADFRKDGGVDGD